MLKNKRDFHIVILIILSTTSIIVSSDPSGIRLNENQINEDNIIGSPKMALDELDGKPLSIHQYANITKYYEEILFPKTIDFDLPPYWTSKNVSINYYGVAKKKDWVENGNLDSDMSGWNFKSLGSAWSLDGYSGSSGSPAGSLKYRFSGGVLEGDYAYFEQNITIPEEFSLGTAQLSVDYNIIWTSTFNGSIFISLIVGGVEKNKTLNMKSAPLQSWESLVLSYDPKSYGQKIPDIATLRVGTHVLEDDSVSPWNEIFLDNIK